MVELSRHPIESSEIHNQMATATSRDMKIWDRLALPMDAASRVLIALTMWVSRRTGSINPSRILTLAMSEC